MFLSDWKSYKVVLLLYILENPPIRRVFIAGSRYKFFSLITDLRLEVTHPDILLFPPTAHEHLLKQALKKKDIYATANLKPMLMLTPDNTTAPVKPKPPAKVTLPPNIRVTKIFEKVFHIRLMDGNEVIKQQRVIAATENAAAKQAIEIFAQ